MTTITKLRREFLQLADTYNPLKHKIAGWYISEKLDGTRCFWDGGVTRGKKTETVPWASVTDPKTGNRKAKIKPVSTGLWSRYGNPIMAPDWFLNALPACPLDGELWAGRGNFQLCRSICAGDEADERFKQIQYAVYSSPAGGRIFADGEIKNANMVMNVELSKFLTFYAKHRQRLVGMEFLGLDATFDDELLFLRNAIQTQNDHVFLHQQIKLPNDEEAARVKANEILSNVLDLGGEGCVLRDPTAFWTPKRHKGLLKFKPYSDAEATVIGFVAGREGKQGNVLGKIGALYVQFGKVHFEIGSGLTFEDREFATDYDRLWASKSPGELMGPSADGKHIKKGSTITFKYRELSDDGVPKEGRFWRRREGVE